MPVVRLVGTLRSTTVMILLLHKTEQFFFASSSLHNSVESKIQLIFGQRTDRMCLLLIFIFLFFFSHFDCDIRRIRSSVCTTSAIEVVGIERQQQRQIEREEGEEGNEK